MSNVTNKVKVAINLDNSLRSHIGDIEVLNNAMLRSNSTSIINEIAKQFGGKDNVEFTIVTDETKHKSLLVNALATEILGDCSVEIYSESNVWSFLLPADYDVVVTLTYNTASCYTHPSDLAQAHFNTGKYSAGVTSNNFKFCK